MLMFLFATSTLQYKDLNNNSQIIWKTDLIKRAKQNLQTLKTTDSVSWRIHGKRNKSFSPSTGLSGHLFTDTGPQSHKLSKIKVGLPRDATNQTAKLIGFRQEYCFMFYYVSQC